MFKGTYKHNLDKKGRLSIPAKLRKYISPEANNTLVMTPALDGSKCINLHPKDKWEKIESRLVQLNEFGQKDNRLLRRLFQYTSEDDMDAQSRILIPSNLTEYANLDGEVLILGVMQRIEIWNPAEYEAYINGSDEPFGQLAEDVMKNKDE